MKTEEEIRARIKSVQGEYDFRADWLKKEKKKHNSEVDWDIFTDYATSMRPLREEIQTLKWVLGAK